MSPRSARLARIAALAALAPFLAGAHCNEDCGKPGVTLVGARNLERTVYGPAAFLARPSAFPLAKILGPYERAEVRVDVSRPVAVVLVSSFGARALGRLDGAKLKPGDHGEGFQVIAVVESRGTVPIFADKAARDAAQRERFDALVLFPRDHREGPWEAAVALEVGRFVERKNDPRSGKCEETTQKPPSLPEWSLITLPLRCGDGVRQDEEDCDDGNRDDGDGCNAYCIKER
jgi:cysteine-rich repeat protein